MARARNIKPGFCQNEHLAELPFETRLTFALLPMFADREGRLEDRPKQIKMKMYPADSLDMDRLLAELHDSGFIQRYTIGKHKYIQILKFHKHQKPHPNEKPSEIPAFSHQGDKDVQPRREASNTKEETAQASYPYPSSLNVDSLKQTGSSKKPMNRAEYPEEFESTWKDYPARDGSNPKKAAFSAYRQRLKEGVTHDVIADGVLRYAAWCKATGKTGQETVMQAKRFFGPGKEWENAWDAAAVVRAKASAFPRNPNEIPAWAAREGHPQPRPGEEVWQYRQRTGL